MPVETRVIEVCPGEWIVQFSGGLNSWVQLGDTFATEVEAQVFLQDQLDSADYSE